MSTQLHSSLREVEALVIEAIVCEGIVTVTSSHLECLFVTA